MRFFLYICFTAWAAAASGKERVLFTPDPHLAARAALTDAKTGIVPSGTGKALKVVFGHQAPFPNIRFESEKAGYSPDWSDFRLLGITLENPTKEPVRISIRVDSPGAKQGRHGEASLMPGEKRRVVMPLGGKPIIGMRGQPPAQGVRKDDLVIQPSPETLDTTKISRFQIFLNHPDRDSSVLIYRVELAGDARGGPGAFVDRFGQYSGADWPGKLHGETDFAARLQVEAAGLTARPSIPGRDKWGGWADGPTLKATGRFHAAKYNGKWWLVDPDGKLFWSNGIDCVNFKQGTRTNDREKYFEWLPGASDPLRQFYASPARPNAEMNFFAANLFRKYGPEYQVRYYDMATKRFRSWGVNTVANWSDYAEISKLGRVPYTIPIGPRTKTFVAQEHLKAGLVKQKFFPDVFDPRYVKDVETALAANAVPYKDDPWLLGVFVDNELPWSRGPERISAVAFKNDGSFAIKKALVQALEKKFTTVAALNRVLGTNFGQWDNVLAPVTFTEAQKKNGAALFAELDGMIAEQYFRTISQAMKKLLPGVPYLGCRFASYSDEVVRQAARYCGVVSFNIYEYLPEQRLADELSAKYDFPVVIGEFHFGALDRGMFDPGLRRTKDQNDRAAKYIAYMEQAARGAWCVGAHWFQYVDQPLTGRADGENYNIGMIDGADTPYPEMVEAVRKVSRELYQIRMGK